MKDEEEVDVAAANARLASMDLSAPAPTTRKPRADKGTKRPVKAKEAAPVHPGGGVMTPSQRARAGELLEIVEDAHQAVYFTTEKYNKAYANFHAYLDELTSK